MSLIASALLGGVALGQFTQPATVAELGKFTYSIMRTSAENYDDKTLTQWAMVYVFNNSDQTIVNPVFRGTFHTESRQFAGKQTKIKFSSAIPGSFYNVVPPGVVTSVLVTFEFPVESYNFGRRLSVRLVAGDKMRLSAPLTQPNAIRQFLIRSTGPQITQAFKKQPALARVKDEVGMPPMGMAILSGAAGNVKALEAAGLKVNAPLPHKITALHLACEATPEMIGYIRTKHIPWTKDEMGYTPLSYAVYSARAANVKVLRPTKSQLAEKAGALAGTALHDAVAIGEPQVIQALISLGADPNALNGRGEPPIANSFDHSTATIRKIIGMIKPNLKIRIWKEKYSLLQWAVLSNKIEAVRALMASGLSPREKNAKGQDCFALLDQIKHPVDREQMRAALESS